MTLCDPDDLGKLRMSSGWHSTLAISHPNEIRSGVNSSGWFMDTAVCHPDDISYHHMSSEWLSWSWHLTGMSYDNVIMSSGWHTLRFSSHPDDIANFDFSQHAVALQRFRTEALSGPFFFNFKRPWLDPEGLVPWWRHQMETFSALLAICAGNSPVPGEFPAQRPVTQSFDVFFDHPLNKRLSKQWWCWWFETLSRPLWRHCNAMKYSFYWVTLGIGKLLLVSVKSTLCVCKFIEIKIKSIPQKISNWSEKLWAILWNLW